MLIVGKMLEAHMFYNILTVSVLVELLDEIFHKLEYSSSALARRGCHRRSRFGLRQSCFDYGMLQGCHLVKINQY